MNEMNSNIYRPILAGTFVLIAVIGLTWNVLAGSEKTQSQSNASTTSESQTGPSGEKLWSNNCQRCHNLQSPAVYSPAQWQVVVHHMRIRANLTGADARAILEFLKSSSR